MTRLKIVAALLLVLTTVLTQPTSAQEEHDDILAAVQQFFDAMSTRDTSMLYHVVVRDGQYHRVRETETGADVARNTFVEFANVLVSNPGNLLERMWDPVVMQHGPVAVVWTPYDFYNNGRFSHCGVDAFSLVRTGPGTWKISGIIYTVEPRDCPESPLGPPGE